MVADLCMGVEVVGAPTVREADGLALSSRNAYLDPEGRKHARSLSRALQAGLAAAPRGPDAVVEAGWAELASEPGVEPDYVVVATPDLAGKPEAGPARLLVAARVGATRLIDNTSVVLGNSPAGASR
jgi:pantoate--beta-alanine ligase